LAIQPITRFVSKPDAAILRLQILRRRCMKRFLAIAVVLGLALSSIALAGDAKMGDKPMTGSITKVDADQKMMMVKDKSGKEWSIYWNDSTKVEGGAPKEGATVWFKAAEKDGKMWATWVKTEAAKGKM